MTPASDIFRRTHTLQIQVQRRTPIHNAVRHGEIQARGLVRLRCSLLIYWRMSMSYSSGYYDMHIAVEIKLRMWAPVQVTMSP